jgi:hypothetical protein
MQRQQHGRAAALALTMALGILPVRAEAQRSRTTIPADTVVRAQLTQEVSSRTARRGDRVTARLDEDDRSGFPRDTRFEGVITEVRRPMSDRPAILDMEFRRAILPDGATVGMSGQLASLSEEDVRRTPDGRLESRRGGGGFDWKWVGYGAAGGAVLGEILGDDFLKGGLLGGLAGAIYGYINRDRDGEYRDINLSRGTEFGIGLNRQVAFNHRPSYGYTARDPIYRDRVAGSRETYPLAVDRVFLDGREVRFGTLRPQTVNGILYVPLRPLAQEAGWTFRTQPNSDRFTLISPTGQTTGTVGQRSVLYRGGRAFTLEDPPMRMGGEIYVPAEYLSRTTDVRVDWDRRDRRLNLTR